MPEAEFVFTISHLPPIGVGPNRRRRLIYGSAATWDWSDEKHYLHDLISTDKRNPTVNSYGPLFGQSEYSWDNIPILDPVKNTAMLFHAPIRDPNMHEMLGPGHAASERPLGPSAYWGDEKVWNTHINNHNATIDSKGRVWLTAAFRNSKDQPAWCKQDSGHPSAKLFPLNESHRTLAILEPKTMKYTFIDTCFGTHHLNFAYDANETLWTSGGGPVLGWFNTKVFDETGDVAKAQGWTAFVLDTKGDGKRGEYTEPNQPVDPNKDRRIPGSFYAVSVNPVDGSIWALSVFSAAGRGLCASIRDRTRRKRRSRRFITSRAPVSARAAATSTRRA